MNSTNGDHSILKNKTFKHGAEKTVTFKCTECNFNFNRDFSKPKSCKNLSAVLNIKINGHKVNAIVDTGAQHCVMSLSLYNWIKGMPDIDRTKQVKIETAGEGLNLIAHKSNAIPIQIDGKLYEWDFYVGKFNDNCLIGMDFLKHYGAKIDFATGDIEINGMMSNLCYMKNGSTKVDRI